MLRFYSARTQFAESYGEALCAVGQGSARPNGRRGKENIRSVRYEEIMVHRYLQWISVGTGFFAAMFWLLSAWTRFPDLTYGNLASMPDILNEQSNLSAIAAALTAASVLAQCLHLVMLKK